MEPEGDRHDDRGPDHVDADQDGREPREVLRVADDPLDHHGPEEDPARLLDPGRGVGLPEGVEDDE